MGMAGDLARAGSYRLIIIVVQQIVTVWGAPVLTRTPHTLQKSPASKGLTGLGAN
jgi:hypothetical protein